MSKRALAFAVLVYAEVLLGEAAQPLNRLHSAGACAVAIAATWVWIKTKGMHGWTRGSASLIVVLTALSLAAGIATMLDLTSPLKALHHAAALTLFLAAVWHAYEMRIYSAD